MVLIIFSYCNIYLLRCELKILELLIAKGVQLDSLSTGGKSALLIAVVNQFTDCARLLVQHGCDVNIQVYLIANF